MPSPLDQNHGASDVRAARRDDLTRVYERSGRGARLQTLAGVVVIGAAVLLVLLNVL